MKYVIKIGECTYQQQFSTMKEAKKRLAILKKQRIVGKKAHIKKEFESI